MSETLSKPKKMNLVDRLIEARAGVPVEQATPSNQWESSPEDFADIPTPDGVGIVSNVEGKLASLRGLANSEVASESSDETSEEFLTSPPYDSAPIDAAKSPIGRLMQRFADRVENGAHRADRATELASDGKEYAKNKLRGAGRAALRAGKASAHATSRIASATAEVASRSAIATAEFAVGTGVITGQKGLELADRADAAVIGKVESAATAAKDAASGALDKVGDKLIGLKKAALARRKARREVWAKRFNSAGKGLMDGFAKLETGMDIVGDKMINAKDKVIDKTERTKASVNRRRNLGRLAIDSRRS